MVDKVVPAEEIMSTAQSEMSRWLKIPSKYRVHIDYQLDVPTSPQAKVYKPPLLPHPL